MRLAISLIVIGVALFLEVLVWGGERQICESVIMSKNCRE